jgi:ribonuclease J
MTIKAPEAAPGVLEVVPLGGLNEFGMNMLAVSWAETCVVIDAGVMFPEPEQLGVDLIIPDLTYLQQKPGGISALVLTHGHEDHIGAVAHLLPLVRGPIYATALTQALVELKLSERGHDISGRAVTVRPRERVSVGDLTIEFLRVTHSMPDCVALAITTPVGTIVHTGDFKIDQTPLDGERFDFHRFAELGGAGVLALFGDSTNVERGGFAGSELDVVDAFEEIFSGARGKLIVTTFATSLFRMQILIDLARQFGRKVAFFGRGIAENAQIAQRLGHLRVPPGISIRDVEVRNYRPQEVLCLTTGSQGEPMAALSRIAIDDHRHVSIHPDDTVVFSSRQIPGNEKAIDRVINHIARRGAEVILEGIKHVHVSGHGNEEELKLMISLVRPRFFIPIHGGYRQRARHARVAERLRGGLPGHLSILMPDNGDVMHFDANGGRIAGRTTAGRVLIDGSGTGEVDDEILRDRRNLAADGLIVPVLAINKQTGTIEGVPDIVTRGLVLEHGSEALLREAGQIINQVLEGSSIEERTDQGLIKEKIRAELRRFFRKRFGRRPLVVPVVMEV